MIMQTSINIPIPLIFMIFLVKVLHAWLVQETVWFCRFHSGCAVWALCRMGAYYAMIKVDLLLRLLKPEG